MTALLLLATLLLAGCAQYDFQIDDQAFAQEQMAHAATLGTIYLNDKSQQGDHNCDDTPENCCVAGYHFCDVNEVRAGGRRMEYSGTERETTPYNTNGDVQSHQNSASYDCSKWSTTTSSRAWRTGCLYTTTITCDSNNGLCTGNLRQWCCSR